MNADPLSRLEQTMFGAELTPRCLQRLEEVSQPVTAKRGHFLFHEGAQNANVYLLLRGRIDLAMTVPGRGAVRILTLGPGDIIAWSAVLAEGQMTCSAQALEDSELLAYPGPKLKEMMERDHDLGLEFLRALAAALTKRLVATRVQLLDVYSTNLPPPGNHS